VFQAAENTEGVSFMDLSTFIIAVFCLIDDWLKGKKLRQRGPSPELSDAEVLTIEIVGEFLGIDTDEGLYEHFRRHYGEWFPALRGVHRTTFLRQAANLVGREEDALEAPARPDTLRPGGVLDRQLPGAGMPLREGLPLQKVGRAISFSGLMR